MQVTVDRFEGEYAIVEYINKKVCFEKIPRVLIPDASEGDVIDITVNRGETEKRQKRIKNLMDSLFE